RGPDHRRAGAGGAPPARLPAVHHARPPGRAAPPRLPGPAREPALGRPARRRRRPDRPADLPPARARRPPPRRRPGPAPGPPGAAFLLAGLLAYPHLPLAAAQDPPLNWNDPRSLEGFWQQVSRSDYGSVRLSTEAGAGSPLEHIALLAGYLFDAFTPPGCLLAVAGAWWLARYRPIPAAALVIAFLSSGPLFLAYAN